MLSLDRYDDGDGSRAVFNRTDTTKLVIGNKNAVDAVFAAFDWIAPFVTSAFVISALYSAERGVEWHRGA